MLMLKNGNGGGLDALAGDSLHKEGTTNRKLCGTPYLYHWLGRAQCNDCSGWCDIWCGGQRRRRKQRLGKTNGNYSNILVRKLYKTMMVKNVNGGSLTSIGSTLHKGGGDFIG